jgi:hypothetical protein
LVGSGRCSTEADERCSAALSRSANSANRPCVSELACGRSAGRGTSDLSSSQVGAAGGLVDNSAVGRAGAGVAGRARSPITRTMFGSITISVGPPIIRRCSILSRRISTTLRLLSTRAASITASRRGWRLRALPPSRLAPNRRTSQAVTPISAATTRKAMTRLAGRGNSKSSKIPNVTLPKPLRSGSVDQRDWSKDLDREPRAADGICAFPNRSIS